MKKYFSSVIILIIAISAIAFNAYSAEIEEIPQDDCLTLYNSGFLVYNSCESERLGADITSILATDKLKDSRAVINTNFSNLNSSKLENSDFTGSTGITYTATGTIAFDCSEVEGTGINCVSEAITLDNTGDWTGTLDSIEGAAFFTEAEWFGTSSAPHLTTLANLNGYIDEVGYFATTTLPSGIDTDDLSEGSSNLYWTNDRFDTRLIATSTILEHTQIYVGNSSDKATATSSITVLDSGYVGIGTTTPAYILDVYGNIRIDGDITGDLLLETIGATTLDDVQDWLNIAQSSGKITNGDTITDGGSGTINIKAGAGFIKTTDNATGTTPYFEWSAINNFAVDTDVVNYIYADYNAGSPVAASTTDRSTIELNRNFTIGRVYYTGTEMKIINSGMNLSNNDRNNHERLIKVKGFENANGGVVSEINERYLTSTAGEFYVGANLLTTDAQNSSTTDEITAYYNDGAWQSATTTQISNTHYNNYGVGLVELTAQRYGVHWIYICMCGGGELKSIYGVGDYTLAQAELASSPSTVPDCIDKMAILAAKIIVQKNAANFTSIASMYEVVPGQSSVANHNDLGSIQGGTAGERYHLTLSEHTELSEWLDNVTLGSGGETTLATLTVSGQTTLSYASTTQLTATIVYGALVGNADTATALETARTIAGVSFDGTANINLSSTGLSDTADLLYEAELNTFSELQTQIADETLLKAGTLTNAKYCTYNEAGTDIVCNSEGGSGTTYNYLSQIGDVSTTSLATTNTLTYQGTNWQSTSTLSITADGRIGIGTSDPASFLSAGKMVMVSNNGSKSDWGNVLSADGGYPAYFLAASNGTLANPTIVTSDDNLGSIKFKGYDGTDFETEGAGIYATVVGTPAENNIKADLYLSSVGGHINLDSALYVKDDNNVGIGTSTPQSQLTVTTSFAVGTNGTEFIVNSSGVVGAGTWQGTAIAHEYGGLEADISAYTGLLSITGGSTAEVDSIAEINALLPGQTLASTTVTDLHSLTRYISFNVSTSTMDKDGLFVVSAATSTMEILNPAVTVTGLSCDVNAGTVGMDIGDGSNWTEYKSFNTTASTLTLATNNSFTNLEGIQIRATLSADNVVAFCMLTLTTD